MSRIRVLISVFVAGAAACAVAPAAASADSVASTNWSGYAAHRSGVRFRHISARWRQPSARCTAGYLTYSATWVGLGGYNPASNALEQIGTAVDCGFAGKPTFHAWYELFPSGEQHLSMAVHGGDLMAGSVTVNGKRVTLRLANLTRHQSVSRTLTARAVDISSAEWIEEAPSTCSRGGACNVMPLADFGQVRFSNAGARTTSGHSGAIVSALWSTTKITLVPGGRTFIYYGQAAGATPTALQAANSAFAINYVSGQPSAGAAAVRPSTTAAAVSAGGLQRGGHRR